MSDDKNNDQDDASEVETFKEYVEKNHQNGISNSVPPPPPPTEKDANNEK